MKRWRIGTVSMGVFLIFLGATLFLHQFNAGLAVTLLRNWWPFLLIVLGIEMVLSQYFILRKTETQYGYDLLSVLFVGLIGFASIGVYVLTAAGIWDRITETAGGRVTALEYRTELSPAGPIDKVLLDCESYWRGPIRVWDSPDGSVQVKVRGFTAAVRQEEAGRQTLAAAVQLEQIGRVIYLRLRGRAREVPWRAEPDQVQIMIPKNLVLDAEEHDRLFLGEFHGKVTWHSNNP